MEIRLFIAVIAGIALLLFLILKLRINAFIALLVGSILVGLIAGLDAMAIVNTIQKGMGDTLGFVATVVGLGAMFGAILEASGGAKAIANFMISRFGIKRSPLAMVIAIASGASIFSHVNDSGFWLVGQYLGLSEKETFKSWTAMTTLLAFTGILTVALIYSLL